MNKKINDEFQVLVEKATSGDKNALDNGRTYAFCNFSDDLPQYEIPTL